MLHPQIVIGTAGGVPLPIGWITVIFVVVVLLAGAVFLAEVWRHTKKDIEPVELTPIDVPPRDDGPDAST